MDRVVEYFKDGYNAHTIISYGGTWDDDPLMDADLLVVCDEKVRKHDGAIVEGQKVDATFYSTEEFTKENVKDLVFIYDGMALLDERGLAFERIDEVNEFIASHSMTSALEKDFLVRKTLRYLRHATKNTEEGRYRIYWLVSESLEIYCKLRDEYYLGAKKTIEEMKDRDVRGYELLKDALQGNTVEDISPWMSYVLNISTL